MDQISDRLKSVRTQRALTQHQMAEVLGVPYRTLQDNERGRVQPGATTLAAYAAVGVDLNWLVTGLEHSQLAPMAQPVNELQIKKHSVMTMKPFLNGTISTANKLIQPDGKVAVISYELLPRRGRGTSKLGGLHWVIQRDQSMAPDIPKGSKLIIDMGSLLKVRSGIYLVGLGQNSLARHLTPTEEGHVVITTADGRVESVVLKKDIQSLNILGRVLYIIRQCK
ncbi:hypothetical protein MNBD_ALPHA03-2002 [hydrothermal vent metagenome]|uniref:HTH cro/C1-type domain-containing protein n=1 Tax=hydrothermal vent metagenome TaxID=652676 RepID=A0A3B1AL92_9ZZZZ